MSLQNLKPVKNSLSSLIVFKSGMGPESELGKGD